VGATASQSTWKDLPDAEKAAYLLERTTIPDAVHHPGPELDAPDAVRPIRDRRGREVADSFEEKFRRENGLSREATEADGWSFGVHPMTTVVPQFGGTF